MAIEKYNDTNNFTIHCKHHITSSRDVIIHGILADNKKSMYTHPLILPNLPSDHPLASIHTSSSVALRDYETFLADYKKAVEKMTEKWTTDTLRDTLEQVKFLQKYHKDDDTSFLPQLPFLEWVKKATPINSI